MKMITVYMTHALLDAIAKQPPSPLTNPKEPHSRIAIFRCPGFNISLPSFLYPHWSDNKKLYLFGLIMQGLYPSYTA